MIATSAPRTNTPSQMHALKSIILDQERNASDSETGVITCILEIHTVKHVVKAVIAVATNETTSSWIIDLRKKRKHVAEEFGGLSASNFSCSSASKSIGPPNG